MKALLSLVLGSLVALGCADPSGRYDDFGTRAEDVGFEGGMPDPSPGCVAPAPNSIDGPASIAVETTLGPGLPILYFGHISTPAIDGVTNVVLEYHALDAADRSTPIGEPLRAGPYPIAADGSFEAAIPERELPGEGNPILPGVPITSQLTLLASLCGVADFYCGSVRGTVTRPVQGDVLGQFGLALVDAPPLRPRYGCGPDAIAAPLPP